MPSVKRNQLHVIHNATNVVQDDRRNTYGNDIADDVLAANQYPNVLTILHSQFEFVFGHEQGIRYRHPRVKGSLIQRPTWDRPQKTLHDNNGFVSNLHQVQKDAICHFISFMLNCDTPDDNTPIPPEMWDMQFTNPIQFEDNPHSFISWLEENGGFACFIHPVDDTDIRWLLLVNNPLTVMDIRRNHVLTNLKLIVNYLAHSGIPFNILHDRPPPYAPFLRIAYWEPFGLGFRNEGYNPDRYDYLQYERARNDFLRGPRGQIALQAGGIIWCLAMSVVQNEAVWDQDITYICHHRLHLWGSELSISEQEFMVGTYRIQTSKCMDTQSKLIRLPRSLGCPV